MFKEKLIRKTIAIAASFALICSIPVAAGNRLTSSYGVVHYDTDLGPVNIDADDIENNAQAISVLNGQLGGVSFKYENGYYYAKKNSSSNWEKVGAVGNAEPWMVLSNDGSKNIKFSSEKGVDIAGTMPNRGSLTGNALTATSFPSGYYNGNSIAVNAARTYGAFTASTNTTPVTTGTTTGTEIALGVGSKVTIPVGYYSTAITVENGIKNNGALNPSGLNAGGSYTIPAGYTSGGKVTANKMTGTYALSGAGTAGGSGKAVTDTTKLFWDMTDTNMNRYVSITKSNGATASINAGGSKTISAGYLPSAITITANKPTGKYTVSGTGTAGASGNAVTTNTSQLYWDMGETSMNRYVIMAKSNGASASLDAGGSKTISAGYLASAITVSANKPSKTYTVSGAGTAGASGKAVTDTSKVFWDMGDTNMNRYVSITKGTGTNQSLNAGGSYTVPAGYYSSAVTVTANSLASQTVADAEGQHILTGKSAWVNGKKVPGTMANNGNVTKTLDASTTSYTIPVGYHGGSGKVSITGETKPITPSGSAQEITPTSGKVITKITVPAVTKTDNGIGQSLYTSGYNAGVAATKVGTAKEEHVLSGKTFTNSEGVGKSGSMANRGNITKTTLTSASFPSGYYSGNSISVNPNGSYTTSNSDIVSADSQITGGASAVSLASSTINLGYRQTLTIPEGYYSSPIVVKNGVKSNGSLTEVDVSKIVTTYFLLQTNPFANETKNLTCTYDGLATFQYLVAIDSVRGYSSLVLYDKYGNVKYEAYPHATYTTSTIKSVTLAVNAGDYIAIHYSYDGTANSAVYASISGYFIHY